MIPEDSNFHRPLLTEAGNIPNTDKDLMTICITININVPGVEVGGRVPIAQDGGGEEGVITLDTTQLILVLYLIVRSVGVGVIL